MNGGQINVGMLAGSISVARDVVQDGQITIAGDFSSGGVVANTGSIAVGHDVSAGRIEAGCVDGGITVSGSVGEAGEIAVGGNVTGTVSIAGNLAGSVTAGQVTASGGIAIGQNVSGGQIAVDALAGSIDVTGSVADGAEVVIAGNVAGALVINGDLGDDGESATPISAADLVDGGHIIINGSLRETGGITITGAPQSVWDDEVITFGYDGYDGDEWNEPATVTVTSGPQAGVYDWNTPEHNIFLVRCLVGDLDNDDDVDYDDVDIYAENIWGEANPQAKYCLNHPGLCGSLWYHGDADCTGGVTGGNNEWVALNMRVDQPKKWHSLYSCEQSCQAPPGDGLLFGEGGLELLEVEGDDGAELEESGPTPAEKAALLRAHFGPERLPRIIAICQDVAATLTDPDEAQFWADVAAELAAD